MPDVPRIRPGYPLRETYAGLVALVRQSAPPGMVEVWGVSRFDGGDDFRLLLGRFRLVGISPQATQLALFMEWRKVFRNQHLYSGSPDFNAFEDCFGCLGIRSVDSPWMVTLETGLDDACVPRFLSAGMRLVAAEIRRTHPREFPA